MRAIILAGGKGSRLQPWHTAKCLMPINGVPMIERLLAHIVSAVGGSLVGISICVGNYADHVRNALADSPVKFSDLGLDAMMGERLLAARRHEGERYLICYGDELADVDINRMLDLHKSKNADLTFAAARQVMPGGEVHQEIDADIGRFQRVFGVAPRFPVIIDNASHWVNIGFAIVEPQCWALLKPEDGLSDWINRVSETMNVRVYYHEGRRATVNSLADLAHAEEVWK